MIASLLAALGCGGSDGHPDTGAGAGQPVPPTVNCADFCHRLSTCGVTLCDEDTQSMQYDALQGLIEAQCNSTCDSSVEAMIDPAAWQCLFQSSCRQVLEHNACKVNPASYRCM